LQRFEGGKWLKCPVDLDDIYPVEAGDAANELIAVGPRQEGKPRALCRLDAVSGKLGEVLVQDPGYDPTTAVVYRAPVSRTVLGVRFSRAMSESTWFDESYRGIQKILDGNFAGKVVQIIGSDRAEKRFLLRTYSDRQPVTYYMLDLANKSVGLVKNSAPWIDEARMRPMNVVRFKARDGHVIEAYLTLPAGASKQSPVPLIVLPHGGPWARDSWGFDSEVQFFASRGYAVVQPNYRGSPGYNWTFPVEDEWAFRKMHADVTDCVRKIVGSGLVDPARVAIVGTSFGGYLAACGAAFEPGLYRCAVTVSGVFDWAQVMREAKYDQYTEAKFGILRRNLGDPRLHAEEFEAISPLRHMDQAKIPFFVAHGKEDNVAEVSESRALIAELKKFHIPYEAMLVGGEGHGMHFLQNEVELYARIELFLAANLKTAVPAAAVP
jgi:dipeptidyl aminopeptidase/acylaminoacyl peptidase